MTVVRMTVGEDIEPGMYVGIDPATGMLVRLEAINTVGAQGWAGEALKKGDTAECNPEIAALWKKEVKYIAIAPDCHWEFTPLPMPVKPVLIDYTNWKGNRRSRKVLPIAILFGTSQWHTEAQWLLSAYDLEEVDRPIKQFAMTTIHSWIQTEH